MQTEEEKRARQMAKDDARDPDQWVNIIEDDQPTRIRLWELYSSHPSSGSPIDFTKIKAGDIVTLKAEAVAYSGGRSWEGECLSATGNLKLTFNIDAGSFFVPQKCVTSVVRPPPPPPPPLKVGDRVDFSFRDEHTKPSGEIKAIFNDIAWVKWDNTLVPASVHVNNLVREKLDK